MDLSQTGQWGIVVVSYVVRTIHLNFVVGGTSEGGRRDFIRTLARIDRSISGSAGKQKSRQTA
eukprot:scaffold198931_cov32-Attheya_sp.AAC.1